jgi:[acyl-carrier-protein] S-malonyltransferase
MRATVTEGPMARALVFPGQGSQAQGMGRELAEAFASAREVFQEVDEALKQKLSKLMFEGPLETLTLTENAQPALLAASLAVMRALERETGFRFAQHAAFVAGHSLGEYSALAAAGAFSLADAARLVKRRGIAMQRAVPVGEGAMAAFLGCELDQARAIADEAAMGEVCVPANDNGGGQVVVSGTEAAVQRAVEIALKRGVRRAVMLPVSAPFHSPLMAPAAREMEDALAEVAIAPPRLPLLANVTAKPVSNPETIRRLLVEQVTGLVRWRETIESLGSLGVDTVVEIGAGKVLSGLTKRINRDLMALSVGTPAELEAFTKML